MIYHVDIHVYIYLPSQTIDIYICVCVYIYILFFLFFNRTNYRQLSFFFLLSLIDRYLHKKRIMFRNSIRNTFFFFLSCHLRQLAKKKSSGQRWLPSWYRSCHSHFSFFLFFYVRLAEEINNTQIHQSLSNNNNYSTDCYIHCLQEGLFLCIM